MEIQEEEIKETQDKKIKMIEMIGKITKNDYVDSMYVFIEILYKKSANY